MSVKASDLLLISPIWPDSHRRITCQTHSFETGNEKVLMIHQLHRIYCTYCWNCAFYRSIENSHVITAWIILAAADQESKHHSQNMNYISQYGQTSKKRSVITVENQLINNVLVDTWPTIQLIHFFTGFTLVLWLQRMFPGVFQSNMQILVRTPV